MCFSLDAVAGTSSNTNQATHEASESGTSAHGT